MAEWEKLWKCRNCGNWNDDFRLTCVKCGKSKLEAWEETAYRCKKCGHFEPAHGWGYPKKCRICGE